jgi:hypothetical protein
LLRQLLRPLQPPLPPRNSQGEGIIGLLAFFSFFIIIDYTFEKGRFLMSTRYLVTISNQESLFPAVKQGTNAGITSRRKEKII